MAPRDYNLHRNEVAARVPPAGRCLVVRQKRPVDGRNASTLNLDAVSPRPPLHHWEVAARQRLAAAAAWQARKGIGK